MGAWIAERLNRCDGRGAVPHSRRRASRRSTRRASRSTIRRPTPRSSRRSKQGLRADRRTAADPPAAPHQRPGILRRAGGEFPSRSQPEGALRCRVSNASKILEKIPRHGAPPRADRRRRRRHRPFGEMRGGGRHRPHHHLQFRPLPHGRPRLGRGAARLRQRQRDREGDGGGGAAGGEAHAGARRRQRHRPVRADEAVPRRAEGDGLFRRAEFSHHRPFRRRHARRASRRPAWASASRST